MPAPVNGKLIYILFINGNVNVVSDRKPLFVPATYVGVETTSVEIAIFEYPGWVVAIEHPKKPIFILLSVKPRLYSPDILAFPCAITVPTFVNWRPQETDVSLASSVILSKFLFNLSASATRNGLSLIGVIMRAETSKVRFSEASKLLNYGFGNYQYNQVATKGEPVGECTINKGIKLKVLFKQILSFVAPLDSS